MTPKDRASLHAAVFRNSARDESWVGYWLARHQQSENLDEHQLADRLGLTVENLALLCLCRTPRDEHFREDLAVICTRTGASETALAQLLRQEQTLQRWKTAGSSPASGWLMAASDRPTEAETPRPPEEPHDQ